MLAHDDFRADQNTSLLGSRASGEPLDFWARSRSERASLAPVPSSRSRARAAGVRRQAPGAPRRPAVRRSWLVRRQVAAPRWPAPAMLEGRTAPLAIRALALAMPLAAAVRAPVLAMPVAAADQAQAAPQRAAPQRAAPLVRLEAAAREREREAGLAHLRRAPRPERARSCPSVTRSLSGFWLPTTRRTKRADTGLRSARTMRAKVSQPNKWPTTWAS